MGMSGIGPSELVVILLIALMVFGTKRLKTLGGDLGHAIKSFREAMNDSQTEATGRPTSGSPRRALSVSPSESSAEPTGTRPVSSEEPAGKGDPQT